MQPLLASDVSRMRRSRFLQSEHGGWFAAIAVSQQSYHEYMAAARSGRRSVHAVKSEPMQVRDLNPSFVCYQWARRNDRGKLGVAVDALLCD